MYDRNRIGDLFLKQALITEIHPGLVLNGLLFGERCDGVPEHKPAGHNSLQYMIYLSAGQVCV